MVEVEKGIVMSDKVEIPGRPRKFTPEQEDYIIRAYRGNGGTLSLYHLKVKFDCHENDIYTVLSKHIAETNRFAVNRGKGQEIIKKRMETASETFDVF